MRLNFINLLAAFILNLGFSNISYSQLTENVLIVIIDGARYTETFGDASHEYIPEMYDLSLQGAVVNNFNNDGTTYTSRAIPALWCGAWTEVRDTLYNDGWTSYAVKPTIFEYLRKQKNIPADECYYVLKYIPNLWLPSFDADYGPDYWPAFHSVGDHDNDVAYQTEYVMDNFHPQFLWVYLADTDHAGHSGIWDDYINAIANADQIVGNLWDKIQANPHYANKTTMIVTNDHGRHNAQHGGFDGHGCSCEGCRHIQFLAIGPDVKSNYISSQYRTIPDMAVTASYLLGVNPEKATGLIMHEILNVNATNEQFSSFPVVKIGNIYPNPILNNTNIKYQLNKSSDVTLGIYNYTGEEVRLLVNDFQLLGTHEIEWNCTNNEGLKLPVGFYSLVLKAGSTAINEKLIIIN